MDSKFTNFHDTGKSVIQSAVNEYVNKHKTGRKGLNHDHPKIQTLNSALDESTASCTPPKRRGVLRLLLDFFARFLPGKKNKERSVEYCCFKILEQYAYAKIRGDEAVAKRKEEELRFSGCDPEWVESMIAWFKYYDNRIRKPMYVVYKSINDYAYTLSPKGNTLKVGLIADWGTGEEAAEVILEQLFLMKPDVIIHLGDVYYSGTEKEYEDHYINIVQKLRKKYDLPVPVYNLPGNHDYYSGGQAFYDALKTVNAEIGNVPVQEASYFTLSNNFWHLQGMDTGLHDHDVLKVNEDTTYLEDTEVKWHQYHLDQAVAQKKRIILLSHHQLFSRYLAIAGKSHNPNLLSYFGKYINNKQIAAWFWGHEHLLEIYHPFLGLDKGRCIGNGAVPIIYDNGKPYRETATWKGKPVPDLPNELFAGSNFPNNGDVFDRGFVLLELNDDQTGKARYYTVNDDGKPPLASMVHEEEL